MPRIHTPLMNRATLRKVAREIARIQDETVRRTTADFWIHRIETGKLNPRFDRARFLVECGLLPSTLDVADKQ